jgi:hypothetical protein
MQHANIKHVNRLVQQTLSIDAEESRPHGVHSAHLSRPNAYNLSSGQGRDVTAS